MLIKCELFYIFYAFSRLCAIGSFLSNDKEVSYICFSISQADKKYFLALIASKYITVF